MKQRWLIERQLPNELTLIVPLDSATRDQLIMLMATAIESVCVQHVNVPFQGEPADDPVTPASQDSPRAPQP